MLQASLSLLLVFVFTSLGFLHFYWLFGGNWGLKQVIPTPLNSEKSKPIPPIATLVVALGLIVFGGLYLLKSNFISLPIIENYTSFAYWFIPSIFIVRAIGDFNYLGIFKKIKNTDFAKADSKFFVPLCISIGAIGLIIQFLSK